MIKNKFNNDVSAIKEAINNDRLVLFAGAGVSKDSGIPLWLELEEGIKNRLNESTTEKDALKIAQMLYNEKGEKEYIDIVKGLVFKNSSSYNSIHEILFELNPQHIITTNYDNYFESVINDNGLPYSIVSKDEDLPYARHKKLLLKYHGDFKNHNTVLKENDYLEFSKNHTLKEVFVKAQFSNKLILFVGYSVSDPNLKLLIREIQYLLKKHYQRAYILTTKSEVSDSEIKYFENLGINIIVQDLDLKELTKPKNTNLSKIGLNVYTQLKYIKDFKLYEYRNLLDNKSDRTKIINELYKSLSRFQYIRVLPQNTLVKLYPINKEAKVESIDLVRGTVLKCFDKDLYNIISDYKGIEDEDFSKDEKDKLNYSLSRIAMSGIYSLGKVEKPGSGGSYPIKEELDFTTKIKYNNDCECIDCTLNNYDYSKAIGKIFKYNIDDKSSLWDDLIYAYGLYRIKEFYTCFFALKNIIIKANRLNKLEVSFLAKYNLKRLKWAIRNDFLNEKISWEDIQEISIEIDKISLDEELEKVKYFVDKDMHSFLKEVRDGVYIQRLCNKIDEIFVQVAETVESIKNGGSHSSNVFNDLYKAVRKLKYFLELNFLIGNGFSPVERTLKKSINTFILGYYLKSYAEIERHSRFGLAHILEFDTFMFKLIVEDSDNKELVVILEKNNIRNIKIGEESLGKIFTYINNFLKSSHIVPKYFSVNPTNNKSFTSFVSQNERFKNHLNKKFNAICIVIAYFDFSKEQFKNMYTNLNYYINFMNFEEDGFEYLNTIYRKKFKLLNEVDLTKTLEIFDRKKYLNGSYVLLLESLKKKNKNFKHSNFIVKDFNLDRFSMNFPSFYNVLEADKRKEFKKILEEKLNQNKNGQTFYITISKKIISTIKVKNQYKAIIQKKLEVELDKANVETEFVQFRLKQFFDLVNKGIINTQGINRDNIKEDTFIFLLNPEEFNPQKFKVDWLKYFNWESYCKRYSKIEYIKSALEKQLEKEYDKGLSEVYFKIKKCHQ